MPTANVEMRSSDIVIDTYLQSVLEASTQTRQQCVKLIHLAEANAVTAEQKAPLEIQLELSKQRNLLYAYLAQLRGLNRNAITKVRNTKQTTAEARQEIDRLHLQLQNLYYEERHLRGEIAACESYDHKYQQLPLISIDEFLQAQPEHGDDDEKTTMFARINHELKEREELENVREELLERKQSLIADNQKWKDDLATLDKGLEMFIDGANPIQRIFEKEYLSL